MDCPKCDRELLIDRMDENGLYWYTCINPNCTEYRKAFNPSSGVVSEASIQPKKVDKIVDTTPEHIPDIADER